MILSAVVTVLSVLSDSNIQIASTEQMVVPAQVAAVQSAMRVGPYVHS